MARDNQSRHASGTPGHIRSLGQYFTPRPVVGLCYRMIRTLDPEADSPLIIDPACGEGAFIRYAAEEGISTSDRLFGLDSDPGMFDSWDEMGLRASANLYTHDGLYSDEHTPDVDEGHFDWVLGNPPFGGDMLDVLADSGGEEAGRLAEVLLDDYSIWPHDRSKGVAQLANYPIEVLFLERFWQLARSGGFVALIIPDGILANARLSYAREWLAERASVQAVISLPVHTFLLGGASARASILLFRKGAPALPSIFMAIPDSRLLKRVDTHVVAQAFEDWVQEMSCPPVVKGDWPKGRGGSDPGPSRNLPRLCRPLLTQGGTLSAGGWLVFATPTPQPGARLDPAYYDPKYVENEQVLKAWGDLLPLSRFIEYMTYGQVGRREYTSTGVRILSPANLRATADGLVAGIDFGRRERFVARNSWNDPRRSRLRRGDLLLTNSGVGCIGRPAVFLSDEACNVSQHLSVIRVRNIEPEFLAVYLQTRFARLQIHREKCGVGPSGINFGRIGSILVPVLPADFRRQVALDYRETSRSIASSSMRRLVEAVEARIGSV